METHILSQALEIVSSLALGMCLGFVYDLFRVPRHIFRSLAFVFDLAFCLVLGAAIFLMAMALGGTLRFYMPFAAALGAGLYSALFGRWLRPLLGKLEILAGKGLNRLKNLMKKMNKNFKNIFSRLKKRFRITKYRKDGKLGEGMSNSGPRRARQKGDYHEISQDGHTCKTYYPGSSDLRSFHGG